MELLPYKCRCDGIVLSPDQEHWFGDLNQFVPYVMSKCGFGNGNDPDSLISIINDVIYLIHQFFGGYLRIKESGFRFLFYKIIIPPFWEGASKRFFKQTRTSSKGE